MEESNGDSSAAGQAHDQETQTNFEVTGNSRETATIQSAIPNSNREHHYRHLPSWGGRYPCHPPNYSDGYYPYEGNYPQPPPPPSVPPIHYYQGRAPHWHHAGGAAPYPQTHGPPVPVAHFHHSDYPHGNFYPPNPNEAVQRRIGGEIARPKPEWPRGFQPFPKSTVPSDYLASMHSSHRNVATEFVGPPSTATSMRSTVIDFPSPRASARLTRKRARSNTPSSVESIDLNLLIRNSPDSLLGYLVGTRLSSAGSFGHLSPTGFCTSPACRRTPNAASHSMCPPPFITPPPIPPLQSPTVTQPRDIYPSSTTGGNPPKEEANESMSCAESPPSSSNRDVDAVQIKEDLAETCKLDSTTSPGTSDMRGGSDNEADDGQGEAEELDLTCHWKDCTITFDSQESLVKHVNSDHIKKEKRDFTCYWQDCTREQRPFKAQYMLVVHMRRHTGEKPHKCTYADCSKAYSRLENLKTHLRSHTGERPYVCEVEGCTKAFSNASDRAKHQNRTHSSVKPYMCKVPDCPKRYTDPSSLRKHTKTVHGEQGIKRLKAESGRDRQTQNTTTKSTGPTTGQPSQQFSNANSTSFANSPASDVTSPGSAGVCGAIRGDSYSSSIITNSCDADIVSSSCDISSAPIEIPGNHNGGSLGVSQAAVPMRSPRSPPYVSHLPDILEGDVEPVADDGAVTTVQQVRPRVQSHTVTLPKIHDDKAINSDVISWVNDVHRRMSQTSEASHLSIEMAGDVSRRSSESGWASNNGSRRSSQASPFPGSNTQILVKNVSEIIPYPPNVPRPQNETSPMNVRLLLQPETDMRRASETSTTSTQSIQFNRLSRNSSGYGSQSNLAVIRSSMFHCPFPMGRDIPFYQLNHHHNSNFRRLSDTVICEADSSVMTNQHNKEYRRRSEPTRKANWTSHRPDPSNQLSPGGDLADEAQVSETELISDEFDRSELDAYLTPEQQNPGDLIPPPPRQTQPLRHFPYSQGQQYAEQEMPRELQTIHHRPYQQPAKPPNSGGSCYPQRLQQCIAPNSFQMQRPEAQYLKQQQYLQSVPQGQMVTQYQQRYLSNSGYGQPIQGKGSMASYEEAMVNSMGALTTDGDGVIDDYGLFNGNMVVNDMNTLLNSLAEEDKYLEMKQNSRGMNGSAMSSMF